MEFGKILLIQVYYKDPAALTGLSLQFCLHKRFCYWLARFTLEQVRPGSNVAFHRRKIYCSSSFALHSAHVIKCDFWTGPKFHGLSYCAVYSLSRKPKMDVILKSSL